MNTERKDGWISCAERVPDERDHPVWAAQIDDSKADLYQYDPRRVWFSKTLWRPANLTPPAPPRTPSQSELDEDALIEAWRRQHIDWAYDFYEDLVQEYRDGWFAALRYERARVAAQAAEKKAAS